MEDVNEITELAKRATEFLQSQKWCGSIRKGYFERGWGYIMAVFYFRLFVEECG